MIRTLIALGAVLGLGAASAPAQTPEVEVTILTTNLADGVGKGEWSFAAWVVADGKPYLFDTGWSTRNVLENAEALGIDLSEAEDLILSHHHNDHTGGLTTLRAELKKRNPKALTRVHVAEGIFTPRPLPDGSERNHMPATRKTLEADGVQFFVYREPTEIAPGIWVTGPVPREHDEQNYPKGERWMMARGSDVVPDTVPESQSFVLVAGDGPIVISGCGHAGLINTLDHVHGHVTQAAPQAAIGGFHLYTADDGVLDWASEALAERELGHFVGSHCTGLESVFHIREQAGMSRSTALVGAIGTKFVSGKGIEPGGINR